MHPSGGQPAIGMWAVPAGSEQVALVSVVRTCTENANQRPHWREIRTHGDMGPLPSAMAVCISQPAIRRASPLRTRCLMLRARRHRRVLGVWRRVISGVMGVPRIVHRCCRPHSGVTRRGQRTRHRVWTNCSKATDRVRSPVACGGTIDVCGYTTNI